MQDWRGSGLSILEQPFTSSAFKQLMAETEATCAPLLEIPSNYRVLFMGGASAQLGLLPLNLLRPGQARTTWAATGSPSGYRGPPSRTSNVIASGADRTSPPCPHRHWRLIHSLAAMSPATKPPMDCNCRVSRAPGAPGCGHDVGFPHSPRSGRALPGDLRQRREPGCSRAVRVIVRDVFCKHASWPPSRIQLYGPTEQQSRSIHHRPSPCMSLH